MCSRKLLSNRPLKNKGIKCVLKKMQIAMCWVENKKGKEKTDEGSSVLLYFVTEEGEGE